MITVESTVTPETVPFKVIFPPITGSILIVWAPGPQDAPALQLNVTVRLEKPGAE